MAAAKSFILILMLNSAWRKNMTQNNLTAWRGKKSKALLGKLSAETAVDTFVNSVYRKLLCGMCISHFFEKCSMSSDPCQP